VERARKPSWPAQLSRLLRSVGESAAEFAFPVHCAACGTDLPEQFDTKAAGGRSFCISCLSALSPDIPFRCRRCGAATGPYTQPTGDCVHCRRKPLRFLSVVCLAMYEDVVRQAILSAKWSYAGTTIRALATLLLHHRREALQALQPELVLPIPHHWRQRVVRQFNPAALIAEQLSRGLSLPCDHHILCRRRLPRPQKRVAVGQRFDNQSDSFRVQERHVCAGKRILLVDDVLTTGATCSAAAAALRTAGAREVHVAVLARVLDHSA
jgi:ComF family protein